MRKIGSGIPKDKALWKQGPGAVTWSDIFIREGPVDWWELQFTSRPSSRRHRSMLQGLEGHINRKILQIFVVPVHSWERLINGNGWVDCLILIVSGIVFLRCRIAMGSGMHVCPHICLWRASNRRSWWLRRIGRKMGWLNREAGCMWLAGIGQSRWRGGCSKSSRRWRWMLAELLDIGPDAWPHNNTKKKAMTKQRRMEMGMSSSNDRKCDK